MTRYVLNGKFSQILTIFIALCCTPILFSSCATTAQFETSPVVPAAEGKVKLKQDNNKNYKVEVEVNNLADPKRLPQPANTYVVWADTPQGPQNLGQLKTSSGLFGDKMKASLETVTPYKPMRIFITAENSGTVTTPGYYMILNSNPLGGS